MKLFLTICLVLGVLGIPLPAQPAAVNDLELSGIRIRLMGVGEKSLSPARLILEKQLALSGDNRPSAPLADDLAFFLQQRYLQLGFPQALVDWKLSGNGVILEVKEGHHRKVGTITFTGVEPSQADTLEPYLTRQTREREGRLAKSLPFVQSDLEAGLGLVVRRLQADGYLQARAADPVYREGPEGGEIDIEIPLTPGGLSVFAPVTVLGDPSPLSKEAQRKITGLENQPFSEVTLENVRKEVKGDLQSRGWFAAEVVASPVPATLSAGPVASSLTILPGKVFSVAEVRSDPTLSRGARRVADSVFQNATGQIFDPETLDLLHQRTLDTGIFSRLDVDPTALGPDTLALRITGAEAKPKTLGFFGGYETFYGPIAGLEARHVNFLDTGNSLGFRAELRGTGLNGNLNWTDPAFLGSRNALGVSLGLENFTFKDYTRNNLALRVGLTRRFNRNISAEIFSSFSVSEVESDELTREELGPEEYETFTGGGKLLLDYRDNPLNPRSGWLAGASLEGGFDQGGEEGIGFTRFDLNAAWYQPLGDKWRLALGARAAAIRNTGEPEDLPIDLRVFNGGGTTVRSFAEREMGVFSQRGETPLGGTAMSVFNAEISYRIIQNLEVAGFADAGSLSREGDSIFSTDNLRHAVGMGIRYQLPIGPLRVDYGFNPDRKDGEALGALHVTFGFAF